MMTDIFFFFASLLRHPLDFLLLLLRWRRWVEYLNAWVFAAVTLECRRCLKEMANSHIITILFYSLFSSYSFDDNFFLCDRFTLEMIDSSNNTIDSQGGEVEIGNFVGKLYHRLEGEGEEVEKKTRKEGNSKKLFTSFCHILICTTNDRNGCRCYAIPRSGIYYRESMSRRWRWGRTRRRRIAKGGATPMMFYCQVSVNIQSMVISNKGAYANDKC